MSRYNNLFEGIDLSQYTPEQIMESKKVYDYIVEANEIAKQEGVPFEEVIDEGLFGALVGGAVGSTVGQSIMKAICKCLGIDEKGTLGSLLTSKIVLAAMGTELGYRW